MKRKAIIFLMLCAMVNAGFWLLSKMFYVNVTASLPCGLYMRVPSEKFERGDYIIYEPSNEVKKLITKNGWGSGKHDFLKQIGAVEGEKYTIDAETLNFEIDGKYIGRVFETDSEGNELPKIRGQFEVPQGYILPIAENERSFDGRYSGTISVSQIKTRVVPILIF